MSSGARALYTPEILAAAAGLAAFPWDEALPLQGDARSRSCGSTIAMALSLDGEGRIMRIGLRPHACAVGQAAAHAFATGAVGRNREHIAAARAQIGAWLAGDGPLPDWPGLHLIEAARDYPGRHGAIVLAWDAALAALS
ncbi:iron-sulfur cluster assembly scaffold protein [Novosphingobium cyanobacteriorum]|uniref:Iron-sulfur cluster assembly scaffold protein n=1 Tax=Novosphingobium cyanobacteriorum TaxID=3024215 RepID=A0ABT6CF00_9SPHN|nr:iron-sulfur cluster assembly scaffold protein [Novosphingobium cyanobacteriorum]MDF8331908.1 iron-sulfur cluster assembly scaffold protein [Novosphingobium cyanobacteriorum]